MKEKMEKEDIRKIKELTTEVFKDTSSNYRQKLVYNLLNAVKSENQREFLWTFLRTLNVKSGEKVKILTEKISKFYPLTPANFEKVAYSIILGLLSIWEKE